MSFKMWLISDTHSKHNYLQYPKEDVDLVIHAGDAGSHRDLLMNEAEIRDFMQWFDNLPYKHKVYVPGNHDTSIEAKFFHDFEKKYKSVRVLIHESTEIEGYKIFGSPYTPSFGTGWAYNIARHKIHDKWKDIPQDTDIIITHGPPKGILDLTESGEGYIKQVGCKALLNRIEDINPILSVFGHIHDEPNCKNAGIVKYPNSKTTFVNACVLNLKYNVCNNGQIIEI